MELEELKLFLKVDSEDEDVLVTSLQLAAEEYLANAGITKDYLKELYKLAIKLLVGHWFENREVIGKADKLAFSLSSMIIQLRYTRIEVVI